MTYFQINQTRKYGNVDKEYNGRMYHSKKEANYAYELDMRVRAKEVKSWKPQFKIDLRVNNQHVCNYFVDFQVTMADGSEEWHEVKGFITEVWRLKWKLTEAIYGDKIKLVLIK